MHTLYNVLLVLKFVAFMGMIYLGLHMLVARLFASPDSKVLGFFALVTSPLTGPVRRIVPPGTSEPRVRALALGLLGVVWVVLTVALGLVAVPLGPPAG